VLRMSDRILVMREGRIAGELSRAEASEEQVMQLAVGGTPTRRSGAAPASRLVASREPSLGRFGGEI
jgi:ABC-type uncharacterized transport system ATPase subunit